MRSSGGLQTAGVYPKRRIARLPGKIVIDDSFFDPLPEEELRAWEGR